MSGRRAIVGAADHGGWAVLVTVSDDGTMIDRRRVELVDADLPRHPHHHEGQRLPGQEAVKLVERVRVSADRHAGDCLDALAAAVPVNVVGIAIRRCPSLPPSIAERIADHRAQNVADSVMYRHALADAASSKGWSVHWYDPGSVFIEAAEALDLENMDDHIAEVGRAVGRPWQKDHKVAMAAAIVAGRPSGRR
jgi:hypothetical protein